MFPGYIDKVKYILVPRLGYKVEGKSDHLKYEVDKTFVKEQTDSKNSFNDTLINIIDEDEIEIARHYFEKGKSIGIYNQVESDKANSVILRSNIYYSLKQIQVLEEGKVYSTKNVTFFLDNENKLYKKPFYVDVFTTSNNNVDWKNLLNVSSGIDIMIFPRGINISGLSSQSNSIFGKYISLILCGNSNKFDRLFDNKGNIPSERLTTLNNKPPYERLRIKLFKEQRLEKGYLDKDQYRQIVSAQWKNNFNYVKNSVDRLYEKDEKGNIIFAGTEEGVKRLYNIYQSDDYYNKLMFISEKIRDDDTIYPPSLIHFLIEKLGVKIIYTSCLYLCVTSIFMLENESIIYEGNIQGAYESIGDLNSDKIFYVMARALLMLTTIYHINTMIGKEVPDDLLKFIKALSKYYFENIDYFEEDSVINIFNKYSTLNI